MNKKELGDAVGTSFGGSKAMGAAAVDAVFEAISKALAKGDEVQVSGFGKFEVRNRPARTGRNPRTGESLQIAASKAPGFKAAKNLKDQVNN
ncbi:MAG: HU family DNA-binding protein [Acidimicrobiia bacterium]|jgi:DNA-binding protein HU-beta